MNKIILLSQHIGLVFKMCNTLIKEAKAGEKPWENKEEKSNHKT